MTVLTRRSLFAGAAALAAYSLVPLRLSAQAAGPHSLPPLPYAADALAPVIDAETMTIHHGKHHQAYVDNLNKALADHPDLAAKPLHELLADLDAVPEDIRNAVRNNGGGHANHTMFWEVMGPEPGAPSQALAAAIDRDLGGMEAMKEAFEKAGTGRFGSGWAFVTVTADGTLAITSAPNQDTPLMEGGRVLFGNDVWEHAYYITYRNRRAEYLKAWWEVVDWAAVSRRYDAALAGTLTI